MIVPVLPETTTTFGRCSPRRRVTTTIRWWWMALSPGDGSRSTRSFRVPPRSGAESRSARDLSHRASSRPARATERGRARLDTPACARRRSARSVPAKGGSRRGRLPPESETGEFAQDLAFARSCDGSSTTVRDCRRVVEILGFEERLRRGCPRGDARPKGAVERLAVVRIRSFDGRGKRSRGQRTRRQPCARTTSRSRSSAAAASAPHSALRRRPARLRSAHPNNSGSERPRLSLSRRYRPSQRRATLRRPVSVWTTGERRHLAIVRM